jgi:hypothetical protein
MTNGCLEFPLYVSLLEIFIRLILVFGLFLTKRLDVFSCTRSVEIVFGLCVLSASPTSHVTEGFRTWDKEHSVAS